MYLRGQGLEPDHAMAVEWFRRAGLQGHAVAQYNLGLMYENGLGVEQSDAKAMGWYHLASRTGHRRAGDKLALLIAKSTSELGALVEVPVVEPASAAETTTEGGSGASEGLAEEVVSAPAEAVETAVLEPLERLETSAEEAEEGLAVAPESMETAETAPTDPPGPVATADVAVVEPEPVLAVETPTPEGPRRDPVEVVLGDRGSDPDAQAVLELALVVPDETDDEASATDLAPAAEEDAAAAEPASVEDESKASFLSVFLKALRGSSRREREGTADAGDAEETIDAAAGADGESVEFAALDLAAEDTADDGGAVAVGPDASAASPTEAPDDQESVLVAAPTRGAAPADDEAAPAEMVALVPAEPEAALEPEAKTGDPGAVAESLDRELEAPEATSAAPEPATPPPLDEVEGSDPEAAPPLDREPDPVAMASETALPATEWLDEDEDRVRELAPEPDEPILEALDQTSVLAALPAADALDEARDRAPETADEPGEPIVDAPALTPEAAAPTEDAAEVVASEEDDEAAEEDGQSFLSAFLKVLKGPNRDEREALAAANRTDRREDGDAVAVASLADESPAETVAPAVETAALGPDSGDGEGERRSAPPVEGDDFAGLALDALRGEAQAVEPATPDAAIIDESAAPDEPEVEETAIEWNEPAVEMAALATDQSVAAADVTAVEEAAVLDEPEADGAAAIEWNEPAVGVAALATVESVAAADAVTVEEAAVPDEPEADGTAIEWNEPAEAVASLATDQTAGAVAEELAAVTGVDADTNANANANAGAAAPIDWREAGEPPVAAVDLAAPTGPPVVAAARGDGAAAPPVIATALAMAADLDGLSDADRLSAGLAAYRARDYTGAVTAWLPLAERGNRMAQFYVGGLYLDGTGLPLSRVWANVFWTLAAEQGQETADGLLAVLTADMLPVERAEARDLAAAWRPRR